MAHELAVCVWGWSWDVWGVVCWCEPRCNLELLRFVCMYVYVCMYLYFHPAIHSHASSHLCLWTSAQGRLSINQHSLAPRALTVRAESDRFDSTSSVCRSCSTVAIRGARADVSESHSLDSISPASPPSTPLPPWALPASEIRILSRRLLGVYLVPGRLGRTRECSSHRDRRLVVAEGPLAHPPAVLCRA